MASPLLAALEKRLTVLDGYFIVRRADYSSYTAEDFTKAIAYRLLASAALENYVEQRCLEIAKAGCDRLAKSQPTATGRALIVWSRMQDRRATALPMYIHEDDAISDLSATTRAFEIYSKVVKKSHGINGEDLRNLTFPLGLRDSQVPEVLVNSLDALASKRNPASHTYVKSQEEPKLELQRLSQILNPLRQLDDDLSTVCETWPISHL
jgi:hypothetical protein